MIKLDLDYKQPFSFYFIEISNPPSPTAYLILPNVLNPKPLLFGPLLRLFGTKEYLILKLVFLKKKLNQSRL